MRSVSTKIRSLQVRGMLLCLAAGAASAQSAYITDQISVDLLVGPRSGRVVAELHTGDMIEVLETDDSLGYSRVRVAATGLEGWIATVYVSDTPPAAQQLVDLRQSAIDAASLQEQNDSLRRRNVELSTQLDALEVENAVLASRSEQNWFVVGAAVLAAGIVVGLVAPSLRRRRRSGW